jgi:hypothetical protein
MKLKSIMALAIAAAFALPAAAQTSPRTDTTTGGPLTSGTNAADRTPSTPKGDVAAPAATPGVNTSGTNAADRAPNTPKSEAGAAAGSTSAAGGFSGIDRNGDGFISRDEARDATWSNRFTELDKDNDGRLSASEFNALGSGAAGASAGKDANSPSTTGGMGGSVGPGGTQSGSSTSGIGDKPGQKQ